MKAGAKYTAQEIIDALGVDQFLADDNIYPKDEVIGQLRVRIAGIAGIVKPEHKINVQHGAKKLSVIVGDKEYEIELENKEAKK